MVIVAGEKATKALAIVRIVLPVSHRFGNVACAHNAPLSLSFVQLTCSVLGPFINSHAIRSMAIARCFSHRLPNL